jgi:hypothetical protein
MKKFLAVAVGLAALWTAGDAHAILLTLGDPVITQSWNQGWNYKGNEINTLKVVKNTGRSLGNSPVEKFNNKSNSNEDCWTSTLFDADYAEAKGGHSTNLDFDLHIDGEVTDKAEVYIFAMHDDKIEEAYFAHYDGNQHWDVEECAEAVEDVVQNHCPNHCQHNHNNDDHDGGCTKPVPEPGTLLLLGSGLIGLAVIRRNRKQRA